MPSTVIPTIEIAPGITAGIYTRKRSSYPQARIRIGDELIRRSTHAHSPAGALAKAKCMARHLAEQRGLPLALN